MWNKIDKKQLHAGIIKNLDIAILPIAFLIVLILMSILTGGQFLGGANIRSIAVQLPELGMFTLAIMISMITGGIDLSVISTANLTGVIMALMLHQFIPEGATGMQALPMLFVIIALGLVISSLLGLVNGLFIAYIEVSPILTTLGTMILYEGLTLSITKGYVISSFPESFLKIGGGLILGIPIPFWIFILCAFLLNVLFKYRPLGKYLLMMGSNKGATAYSGIDVRIVQLKSYMLSALCAGVASVIMISRFNSANARYGNTYLLLAALLSIMGGTDPEGGRGKIIGVVMAIIVLQMLTSGLNLLGVTSFITVSLWGIMLILVIYYRNFANNQQIKFRKKMQKSS